MTEIELATQRQLVLDLKAELQKVKEVARVASEVAKVEKTTSYECGVMDTETRLAEEVVGVCRDYCVETWAEALNRAGVLAISELRSTENIFFSEDIRENLAMLPPPTILPSPPSEWPSTIQVPSSGAEVLTGAIKNKKDDMGGPQLEDKGKGKGSNHRLKPITSRMLSQLRMWSLRPKMLSPSLKLGIPNPRRPITRKTLSEQSHSHRTFLLHLSVFYFILYYLFCCGCPPLVMMYPHFDQ